MELSYSASCASLKEVRERLRTHGVRGLSDRDLVRLSIGNVDDELLDAEILPALDKCDAEDIGSACAVTGEKLRGFIAAYELARRRIRPEGIRITKPSDVLPLVSHLLDRKQEHVLALSLSGAHEVIRVRTITVGLLTSCPVHPREVFVGALKDRASALIVAHNHPSGDPTPSDDDRKVTQQLRSAGKILGIRLLDHIVFAKRGLFSFQEHGEL